MDMKSGAAPTIVGSGDDTALPANPVRSVRIAPSDRLWAPAEDALVRQAVRERWAPSTLRAALPERSMSAIASRAKHLKVQIPRPTDHNQKPALGTEAEIVKLLYMRSDSAIAVYLGTSVSRVAAVRAKSKPRWVKGTGVAASKGTGTDSALIADRDAATSSAALRDALARLFHRVAQRDHIPFEAAMRACLYPPMSNGVAR